MYIEDTVGSKEEFLSQFAGFDAILFDMDQTLYDLGVDWPAIKQYFAESYHKQHNAPLPYTSFLQIFHWIQDHHGDQELQHYLAYLKEKEFHDAQLHARPMWLMQSGWTFLQKGMNKKAITGIVSSNFHHTVESVLDRFHVRDQFRVIIGRDDVKILKPNPEGILKILDLYHISPNKAIYIGDMDSDAQTAKAANVHFIFVQELEKIFTI